MRDREGGIGMDGEEGMGRVGESRKWRDGVGW